MDAWIAATRFGLGPRPGELDELRARGPRRHLLDQLADRGAPDGRSRREVLQALARSFKRDRQAFNRLSKTLYAEESRAHAAFAVSTAAPFRERLARFFMNHFTVSASRPEVRGLAGSLSRHAIRPHLAGHFHEMLLEVTRHPAMLLYLDNVRSIGPDSPMGRKRHKGLNENLARELLELHTLGVDGGYEQADVEGLAAMLTGWTLEPDADGSTFEAWRHQPGSQRMLGRDYPDEGPRQGVRALLDLARHPATARHLATKLVGHFVQDEPAPEDVEAIQRAWTSSDGHLPTVAVALVELESAWSVGEKLRTPQELVIATARALDDPGELSLMAHSMRELGQGMWGAPSPRGWSDRGADWSGPDALLARVEWARRVGQRGPRRQDVVALSEDLLGPQLDRSLALMLEQSHPKEALGLLLASPWMQRR
jgi:uncharacterized protein (DUF1800 family)